MVFTCHYKFMSRKKRGPPKHWHMFIIFLRCVEVVCWLALPHEVIDFRYCPLLSVALQFYRIFFCPSTDCSYSRKKNVCIDSARGNSTFESPRANSWRGSNEKFQISMQNSRMYNFPQEFPTIQHVWMNKSTSHVLSNGQHNGLELNSSRFICNSSLNSIFYVRTLFFICSTNSSEQPDSNCPSFQWWISIWNLTFFYHRFRVYLVAFKLRPLYRYDW